MKTPVDIYVMQQIRRIRKEKKMSQRELGESIGVARDFIAKIEQPTDPSKYNVNHLYAIAKTFNCSMREFFPLENNL